MNLHEYIQWLFAFVFTVVAIGTMVAAIGFCVSMIHEGYKLFKRWGK